MHGSIASLKALMTSPRWLAMSTTERHQAENDLLHWVRDVKTLDVLRSHVVNMPALVACLDPERNNVLHTAAFVGKTVPTICALIKEGGDPTALNEQNETPADTARRAGHTLQATLLTRAAEDKRRRDLQQQQTAS